MNKWSKRFKKPFTKQFNNYTYSLKYDTKLIKEEIKCLGAHAEMLKKNKVIKNKEFHLIIKGLNGIFKNKKKIIFKKKLEDIHMNIENLLIKKIGRVGEKIRIARSRNDLITTDLRIWLKKKIKKIIYYIKKIILSLLKIAKNQCDTIMPGFTHFQIAQPVTFGHYLLSYCEMFKRDIYRLKNCYNLLNYLPLGACALSGTIIKTNRIFLAKKLGFKKICRNSIDSVSDRDYVIDFLYSCTTIIFHISRISEEVILFSNSCFGFYDLPDEICSGSSLMPQKKNPDSFELMRAKFGTLIGNLISFFSTIKSLPLAYNKDYQEDKKNIFESYSVTIETIKFFLKIFFLIKINKKNMLKASRLNYSTSTDLAEFLTFLKIPYKKAHEIVSHFVKKSIEKKIKIEKNKKLIIKYIPNKYFKIIKKKIKNILNVKNSVNNRISLGGTSPKNVLKEIKIFKKKIKKCYIKF
ncbi:argininosuccinate lyase [Candidatus Vidania fulgoroideorum]